ncbi:MAG: phthiocerol/phthiodiolone dimycocerosyl transferase family protein [Segniliparus sp.]|uniref:phthiocerol/phthiodiolone dimycocerosyl transferase family protein n=1 Tax=Segniliparus sp. TaxID=2804064 RepID=UPI003F2C1FF5
MTHATHGQTSTAPASTGRAGTAPPQDVVRALSPSEAVWAQGSGKYSGYPSVLLSGTLELGALDEAFAELQRRQESLGSVVRTTGPAVEFVRTTRPPARIRVFEGEDPSIRPTGRGAAFDQTEQLMYVDVVPGEDRTRVTFFFHHAIADGSHLSALFEEFWSLYTARVQTGGFPPAEVQAFPQSGEHYLNRREYPGASSGRTEAAAIADRPGPQPQATPIAEPELPARVRLGKADTAALTRLARAEGLSANALLSAVLVHGHIRAGDPVSLCFYPVDLRKRITPPVEPVEATNLVRESLFHFDEAGPDIIALARKIQDQLAKDLADGTIYQNDLSGVLAQLVGKEFSSILHPSNLGRVRVPLLPEGLAIVDFQGYWPPSPEKLDLSALFGRPVTLTTYLINWFDGQLNADFIVGDHGRRAAILSSVEAELRAAARPYLE